MKSWVSAWAPISKTWGLCSITRRAAETGWTSRSTPATAPADRVRPSAMAASIAACAVAVRADPRPALKEGASSRIETAMEFTASHKYARISARKVRSVATLVRGTNVNRALEVLEALPQRGAFLFKMVLKSALANAGVDGSVNVNRLVVNKIYVNDGPLLHGRPLGRFVALGRWHPIRKRTSHLHVVLAEQSQEKEPTAEKPAVGGA